MAYQAPAHCTDWNPKFGPGFTITRWDRSVEVVRASWVRGWYDVTASRPGFLDCMTEKQIVEAVRKDNPELAASIEAQGILLTESDRLDMMIDSGEIDEVHYGWETVAYKNGKRVKYG